MSDPVAPPKPFVDCNFAAGFVCILFCMTIPLLWKDVAVSSMHIELDSGALPASNPFQILWWLIFPLAVLPALLLPTPRVLGIVPPAVTILSLAMIAQFSGSTSELWTQLVFLPIGMIDFAVLRYGHAYLFRSPMAQHRPMRNRRLDNLLILANLGVLIGTFALHGGEINTMKSVDLRPWLAGTVLVFFIYAWTRLFRPFFELCVEAVVWRYYRIESAGPGAKGLPLQGPIIVIANHACWWDPLFLAKVLPRPVTPMMTSLFYDKWFLKPLMVYVFQTIRVPDARARREAPELQEAIRALDEGKCLVLFPEGYLRRKEDVPLRRFGRGIWEIIKARPDTPVVCCWIEGAWGSYASYWNGPPTKNKVIVRRRPITIGLSEPITVSAEKLERHLATRIFLMNEVSAARKHLGLEPLPTFDLPAKDDEAAPEEST